MTHRVSETPLVLGPVFADGACTRFVQPVASGSGLAEWSIALAGSHSATSFLDLTPVG